MKIRLRNVKHSAAMSRETNAYTAAIHIDGRKVGTAENHGQGGPTRILPREVEERIQRWAETQPEFDVYAGTGQPPKMRKQDAEYLVDTLLTDHLLRRDMRRAMENRILYTRTDQPGIYETNKLTPEQKKRLLATPTFRNAWNVDKILNDLPEEEALALYRPH